MTAVSFISIPTTMIMVSVVSIAIVVGVEKCTSNDTEWETDDPIRSPSSFNPQNPKVASGEA